MILTIKIILILIVVISFMGAVTDDKTDKQVRMTALTIAGIFALVALQIFA